MRDPKGSFTANKIYFFQRLENSSNLLNPLLHQSKMEPLWLRTKWIRCSIKRYLPTWDISLFIHRPVSCYLLSTLWYGKQLIWYGSDAGNLKKTGSGSSSRDFRQEWFCLRPSPYTGSVPDILPILAPAKTALSPETLHILFDWICYLSHTSGPVGIYFQPSCISGWNNWEEQR